jgi:ankyrin repeat protein
MNSSSNDHFKQLTSAFQTNSRRALRTIQGNPSLMHVRGSLGETILHFLAIEDDLEAVETLAKLGANLDTRNDFDRTPLMEVAMIGNLPMAKLLVELGADVKSSTNDGDTAGLLAGQLGNWDVLKYLVEHGANLSERDLMGKSVQDYLNKKGSGVDS